MNEKKKESIMFSQTVKNIVWQVMLTIVLIEFALSYLRFDFVLPFSGLPWEEQWSDKDWYSREPKE